VLDTHYVGHPPMRRRKLLVIASHLLGNQTYANALRDVLAGQRQLATTFLELGRAEYDSAGAGLGRLGDVFRAEQMVKHALLGISPSDYDGVLVLCWEFLTALPPDWLKLPTAVVQDITPVSSRDVGRYQDTRIRAAVRPLIRGLHHWRFSRRVPHVAAFLPMSDWVATSLKDAYGVAQHKVHVAYLPIDLHLWRPEQQHPAHKLRLLFVGNDFAYKGGGFLLRLYRDHLHAHCTLTIVSRDPRVQHLDVPEGVTVRPGMRRQDLVSLYQASDLFVLPTYRDALGHVIAEASACGVPTVARDVGGIHCILKDGVTGRLMDADAGIGEWARVISQLHNDRPNLQRMGRNARSMAERLFDHTRFEEALGRVLRQLWSMTVGSN
jgi:hypothetical protein